jgi:hypothetical protein
MKKIYPFYGKLLSICLIFLGFGSCGLLPQIEYGSPSASYKISGKIVANEDGGGQAIKGLRISLNYSGESGLYPIMNPVYTLPDGQFLLDDRSGLALGSLVLLVEDVDGAENGSFASHTQNITFSSSDFTGGDGRWFEGYAVRNVGTIKLKPVEEE